MLRDVRDYFLGGRVLDLAIGIVLGVAFGNVIRSLVENVVTRLFAAGGEIDFAELSFSVGNATVAYGTFLNDLLSFVVIALSVYFLVVRPMNSYREQQGHAGTVRTATCEACLSTIPAAARRCAFCTAEREVETDGHVGLEPSRDERQAASTGSS